jgi:tetratricopeptide (TPR) repeat protein
MNFPGDKISARFNRATVWLAAHPACIGVLLAAITLAIFYPVTGHDFINFDDPPYVTANPYVQHGLTAQGVAWSFRTGYQCNWHPLTWMSHMLDVQLLGKGPAGPHFVNLLFHIANTVLLFGVFRRMTDALWPSALVAALFAWHPLHVESVAWVAERKDVLSGFLFMLTLLAYHRFAEIRNPKSEIRNPKLYYVLALFFFALGLMSKPMLVTVPFMLLLLDYWPLRRFDFENQKSEIKNILIEKIPFFALSAVSCVVTLLVQKHGGSVQTLADTPPGARIANALVSYARYLGKTVWPTGLAVPYPNAGHWPLAQVVFALVLVVGPTLAALWLGRKFPYVATGWFWFIGTLIPVIGLVQVGDQAMADRYTYLPLIGIFIILAWGTADVLTQWRLPMVAGGLAAGIVLIACAWRASDQLSYWQNSGRLFEHAVTVTKNNWIAWFNVGWYLESQRRTDEALAAYRRAVEIKPNYADGLNKLGCTLANRQQYALAIPYFDAALKAKPDFLEVHNNLAEAYRLLGKTNEANLHLRLLLEQSTRNAGPLTNVADGLVSQGRYATAVPYYEAALRAGADEASVHFHLANALVKIGKVDEAIAHYRQALKQKPDYTEAHNNLGMAFAAKGKLDDAVSQFREAVRCQPGDVVSRVNLGRALNDQRKFAEAIQVFNDALRLAPQNPELHANLAVAFGMKGDSDQAVSQFRETLRLRPNDVVAHFNLANILAFQHQTNEAIGHYTEALRLKPDFAEARRALEALRSSSGGK